MWDEIDFWSHSESDCPPLFDFRDTIVMAEVGLSPSTTIFSISLQNAQ